MRLDKRLKHIRGRFIRVILHGTNIRTWKAQSLVTTCVVPAPGEVYEDNFIIVGENNGNLIVHLKYPYMFYGWIRLGHCSPRFAFNPAGKCISHSARHAEFQLVD